MAFGRGLHIGLKGVFAAYCTIKWKKEHKMDTANEFVSRYVGFGSKSWSAFGVAA